jgi:hypothetical protein
MRYLFRISYEDDAYTLQDILVGYLESFLQDILRDIPSAALQLPANSDWVPAAAPWLCILPTGPVFALDSVL